MMSVDDFNLILKHLEDNNDRWNILTMRSDLERAVKEIYRLRSTEYGSDSERATLRLLGGEDNISEFCSGK
jgi:hypothetical protein